MVPEEAVVVQQVFAWYNEGELSWVQLLSFTVISLSTKIIR